MIYPIKMSGWRRKVVNWLYPCLPDGYEETRETKHFDLIDCADTLQSRNEKINHLKKVIRERDSRISAMSAEDPLGKTIAWNVDHARKLRVQELEHEKYITKETTKRCDLLTSPGVTNRF